MLYFMKLRSDQHSGEWRNGRRAGFRCQCPFGTWGFKSPFAHNDKDPGDTPGSLSFGLQPMCRHAGGWVRHRGLRHRIPLDAEGTSRASSVPGLKPDVWTVFRMCRFPLHHRCGLKWCDDGRGMAEGVSAGVWDCHSMRLVTEPLNSMDGTQHHPRM